jgi:cyclophilin family peptidyl-prolyl cis-trans isomerase
MNKIFMTLSLIFFLFTTDCCNAPAGNDNKMIFIKTTLGDIKIRLYDGTPVHRDNFIKLVKSGIYDGISFHRVIKGFMIQAGDPATRNVRISQGSDSLNTFTLPSEFNNAYFHKKGALAAAREGNDVNPEMRSSGTQFYIVQGTKLTDEELDQAEARINNNLKQATFGKFLKYVADSAVIARITLTSGEIQEKAAAKMFKYFTTTKNYKIPEDQRIIYKNLGGVPRLDGTYTVFGEVTDGLGVVDMIASVPTDNTDKPVTDIKILKMKIVSK